MSNKDIKALSIMARSIAALIPDIKSKKISLKDARVINSSALVVIKATKEGIMMHNHQQLQHAKIALKAKELKLKKEHIQLQYDKMNNQDN